jgi:hypothetical protein
MNIEKILNNTNLHYDIILIIEKEYYKIIKNDCLNQLNCPTYIKSFYKSPIIGRWTEKTQYYYNLKKIKSHYIDHTKLFSYSLH